MPYKKAPSCQTLRVFQALNRLWVTPEGIPLRELAGELGISERQTRRDLHLLQRAGYAVVIEVVDSRTSARLVLYEETPPAADQAAEVAAVA